MCSLVFIREFVRLNSGELSAAPVPDYTCKKRRIGQRCDLCLMCGVHCQGFALSFVIIMSNQLPAFGRVDMVSTGDKVDIKPELLLWLLSF